MNAAEQEEVDRIVEVYCGLSTREKLAIIYLMETIAGTWIKTRPGPAPDPNRRINAVAAPGGKLLRFPGPPIDRT